MQKFTACRCTYKCKESTTTKDECARRCGYPYPKNGRKSTKVIKPEAPYNSNQFLLEDHGNIEELDENLKHADRISTTSAGRTRDSSFSVDSEGEFYSSPDDEEQFLIKDFVDQYESVQAERLQSMSKDELIQEYLMLESKLELVSKRQRKRGPVDEGDSVSDPLVLQSEVERLTIENEALKRENAALRSKTCSSDSEDSETDSNDSCSGSSSSSCCSTGPASPVVDYAQTNGHSASVETV
ncbi:protein HEXIM1 isoform X2 [Tenebrio molitor]|uniref:protein HEXIM1 isoform X2 n=1 Tax=Tenebrio molitor TaxID=7067 RepID=UPI003624A257